MTTAAQIGGGLGLKRAGPRWIGACPVCGYRHGFVIEDSDEGRLLAYCHVNGCTWDAIRARLVKLGLLQQEKPWRKRKAKQPTRIIPLQASLPGDLSRTDTWLNAARIWQRGFETAGTPVETYLRCARGYTGPLPSPDVMRHVHNLWHIETATHWPGMVCLVEHTQLGHVAIHRTWLAQDGRDKAPVKPNKKTLGPIEGGAIRLFPIGREHGDVAVAEGIESALSFSALTGAPVWSAISAGGIEALILPPEVKFIGIAADSDPVGLRAALNAARRWVGEGRTVRIAKPPAGLDFNDVLRLRGVTL